MSISATPVFPISQSLIPLIIKRKCQTNTRERTGHYQRLAFSFFNGHASMLLWSALHLAGVKAVDADYERLGHPSVTLDDILRTIA